MQKNNPRLVRARRFESLDRPPVWMMRQAGRYLPEYQAIRDKVTFLELCKTPDLAVEVSLQPFQRFGMDGVIMFSDILIPVEAMGISVEFNDRGPHISSQICSLEDVRILKTPDPYKDMGFVMEILRQLKTYLLDYPDTALIGFSGTPWTLASYILKGDEIQSNMGIKRVMYNEPALLHSLLSKLSEVVALYLNAQIEAGAQVVQLFDTWAGSISDELYRQFVLPYQQAVIHNIKRDHVPLILYVNSSRGLLPLMAESGADIISLDSLTSILKARELLGNRVALQGNLDPVALFLKSETLKPIVEAMIVEGGNKGYIFNLGHGILPKTPIENVQLVVDTVKQFSWREYNQGNVISTSARSL